MGRKINNASVLRLAVVGVALVVAACTTSSADEIAPPDSSGNPERGQEIFVNGGDVIPRTCSTCHSLDGSIQTGTTLAGQHVSPTLVGISERAGLTVPGLSAEEYIRESILDPQAYVVDGFLVGMPGAYSILLSEEDVDDLVAFLLTQ
jgi:mono/diheme cytochrome c family protein